MSGTGRVLVASDCLAAIWSGSPARRHPARGAVTTVLKIENGQVRSAGGSGPGAWPDALGGTTPAVGTAVDPPGRRADSMLPELVLAPPDERPPTGCPVGPLAPAGLTCRAAPLLAAVTACFATVLLPPPVCPVHVAAASGVTVLLAALVLVLPWRRLPVWAQAVPVLALCVVVALLRDGSGGAASAFTPMVLLPAIWLALYHGWWLVLTGLAATEAVMLGPLLGLGGADYPAGEWRRAIVIGIVGAAATVSTKLLVERSRANAERLVTANTLAHRQYEFATVVLNSTNTLLMVVDTAGRIVGFNAACEALTGYRAEEAHGHRPWHLLARREDRAARAKRFADRLAGLAQAPATSPTVSAPYELEWISRSGQRHLTRWTDSPIRDQQGRITHLVGTGSDITEQRNTEDLLQQMLAAAEQPVIGTDLDGTVTVFNAAAERMLGYRPEEVVGRHTPQLFHDATEIAAAAGRAGVPAGFAVIAAPGQPGSHTRSWTYVCRDGRRIPVELTVSVVHGAAGKPIGYLCVARDITAERLAQAAQRAAYEREKASVRKLRELDRARTEFIAAASHDLRTPLTSIMAYHELLLDPAASTLSDEDRQMIAAAHRNANRLLILIGDLLVMSKIDSGTFAIDPRPVPLDGIIAGVLDAITPGLGDRDLDLRLELPARPPVLSADPAHLERALINVIGNAVKFTPDGGRVLITAAEDSGRVTIRIDDTGPGIPAEEVPRVFQRFFRSTRTRHTVSGSGLGLAITKAIIDAHHGQIIAESGAGHGTRMTITLNAA